MSFNLFNDANIPRIIMHTFYWGCCIWFLLKSIYRVCAQSISPVQLYATPRTVASQAPLSMGFPKQEYWSGLPFPTLEDLLDTGIKPTSPALAGGFFTTEPPGKPLLNSYLRYIIFQAHKNKIVTWLSLIWKGA